MSELFVLHFEGCVGVSSTCGCRASRVVASTERNDVGAVVQRGCCTEGCAVQRQRSTGAVEDLYANVRRATGCRVLQCQNGGVAAVYGSTGECNGSFGCDGSIAIIQLDVKTDRRAGAACSSEFG